MGGAKRNPSPMRRAPMGCALRAPPNPTGPSGNLMMAAGLQFRASPGIIG